MNLLPTLFISHGSPMLAIQDSPARRFLAQFGAGMQRPKAVLMISAHWETSPTLRVSLARQPKTIHDFGAFPRALFEIDYPAPGAPDVGTAAAGLLQAAGFPVEFDQDRGLDHGMWVPLRLMFPQADVPVAQLSLPRGASPQTCLRIGAALHALRAQGVLIIASGSLTHNLGELRWNEIDAPAPAWVSEFGDWVKQRLEAREDAALADYRRQAPHGARNHPSEEHFTPLFIALGAAGGAAKAHLLHSSHEYGVLAMDMYAFNEE